jgi:hypothetical protein
VAGTGTSTSYASTSYASTSNTSTSSNDSRRRLLALPCPEPLPMYMLIDWSKTSFDYVTDYVLGRPEKEAPPESKTRQYSVSLSFLSSRLS